MGIFKKENHNYVGSTEGPPSKPHMLYGLRVCQTDKNRDLHPWWNIFTFPPGLCYSCFSNQGCIMMAPTWFLLLNPNRNDWYLWRFFLVRNQYIREHFLWTVIKAELWESEVGWGYSQTDLSLLLCFVPCSIPTEITLFLNVYIYLL